MTAASRRSRTHPTAYSARRVAADAASLSMDVVGDEKVV